MKTIAAQPEEGKLATVGTSAIVTAADNVPEYLRKHLGNQAGLEQVDREDTLIPRLCVAGSTTPQLDKSNESFIKGLQVGEMFNSLTGENYGETVTVIPLFFFKTFIKFKKTADGSLGGIETIYESRDQVPDAELLWIGDSKPVTTKFLNVMSLIVREGVKPEPISVSFKSTGLKFAKKWVSMMKGLNLPCYVRTYSLDVVDGQKGQLKWKNIRSMPGSFVPEGFVAQAERYFTSLQDAGVKVDTTGVTMDDEPLDREPGSDDDAPRY